MHKGAGKEAGGKADKATPAISKTNIKLIKLNKTKYEQNQLHRLRLWLHETSTLKE